MSVNSLEELAKQTAKRFNDKVDAAKRLKFAAGLAEAYGIPRAELVLVITHPELSRLPINERLKKVGVTEEEFMSVYPLPGFQKFVSDFSNVLLATTKQQALESTGEALKRDRFDADDCLDHGLEKEMIRLIASERGRPQVAVQVNNVWGEARQEADVDILATPPGEVKK